MKITINRKEEKLPEFKAGDHFILGAYGDKIVRQIVPVRTTNSPTRYGAYRLDTGEVYNVCDSVEELVRCYGITNKPVKVILEDAHMTFKEV